MQNLYAPNLPYPAEFEDHGLIDDYSESQIAASAESVGEAVYLQRPRGLWIPFLVPIGLCGIPYLLGSFPLLTDIGFASLGIICAVCLFIELLRFPQRYGIGGMLLFGGVLVWFIHDYMNNWFGADVANMPGWGDMRTTLAKTTYFYSVFVLSLVIGLGLPRWRKIENLLGSIPEPPTPGIYLMIVVAMLSIGWSAFLFTADPLPVTLFKAAFGPWLHEMVNWTVTRTGNYNTNWGAYVAQILDVGAMGGIIAALYAVFVARSFPTRLFGWSIWAFWLLYNYGGGRRGPVAYIGLPAVAFVYLKFQTKVIEFGKKHSFKGYIVVGALGLLLLLIVQIQGKFRGSGLGAEVDVSQVNLLASQGNLMFTESLEGFRIVPDERTFFSNSFPGEGIIRPMPETLFWFLVGPVPRALWTDKPSDAAMIWYNKLIGGGDGREGTTIAQGIVGHWYFRYGVAGVIEGGILIGWLMGMSERLLQRAAGRPMTILASLCLATWLFRNFRNFYFIELYGPMIGICAFVVCVTAFKPFAASASAPMIEPPAYE